MLVISICSCAFIIGLTFCTKMADQMVAVFDSALSTPSLIFTLAQVILICWVFGMDNFLKCLKEMEVKISTTAEWYLIIYGKFTLPLVLLALLVSDAYANLKNLIGGDKMQMQQLQLILTISSISLFPIMALWEFVKKCRCHD